MKKIQQKSTISMSVITSFLPPLTHVNKFLKVYIHCEIYVSVYYGLFHKTWQTFKEEIYI